MRLLSFLSVTLWLFLVPVQLKAQQKLFGFHLTQKRKVVRVPFESHCNLVIVPIRINNSDTLRFILDTGVSNTIVTDPCIAEFVNQDYPRSIAINGLGSSDSVQRAQVSIGNTLHMGQVRTYEHNLLVFEKDLLQLSEFVGTRIHGLLGYELFEQFVITIDFRRHQLVIQNPNRYRYRRSAGSRVPIRIDNKRPYLEAVKVLEGGREVPLQVLLDTGAGHALMLNTYTSDVPLPNKVIGVQLGIGLGGIVNGHLGRMEKLQVGRYELTDVLTSFPDSSSFSAKMPGRADRQGNIGGELLRRFTVTYNYRDQYIALKPHKKLLKEKFEHDMSGMDLRAKGEEFNTYYVDRVIENSPADLAGVEKDDKILFINNTSVTNLTMTGIYKLLQRKEGKQIDLIIRRGERLVFTSFILKRII
ncbi:hypothetical protein HNQ92_002999 [Rhabdobacter roseus]|uniref:PDZ domain-containing protein n=2 Tax=Rhabdobacter roseus TaxID=1655419 RepID=A0A840TMK8_9BACT|nr:hypothetical protein [Rhabdobacter roseus]